MWFKTRTGHVHLVLGILKFAKTLGQIIVYTKDDGLMDYNLVKDYMLMQMVTKDSDYGKKESLLNGLNNNGWPRLSTLE